MNVETLTEKHPLQPLTWMGKGSHASGAQQSDKAVDSFYNSAFSSLVKEILFATNCLQ